MEDPMSGRSMREIISHSVIGDIVFSIRHKWRGFAFNKWGRAFRELHLSGRNDGRRVALLPRRSAHTGALVPDREKLFDPRRHIIVAASFSELLSKRNM